MPKIIAHRGLRHEGPETSLLAIQLAIELPGLFGVGFDTELTADNDLVVLHQEAETGECAPINLHPVAFKVRGMASSGADYLGGLRSSYNRGSNF